MNQDHPPVENGQVVSAESSNIKQDQLGLLRWWKWYLLVAVLGAVLGISGLPGELQELLSRFTVPPEPEAAPTILRSGGPTSTHTSAPTPVLLSPANGDETLVLVADFHSPAAGPSRAEQSISRDLAEQLHIALVDYPDIRIEHLDHSIEPQNGSEQARSLAQNPQTNASIVIWSQPTEGPNSNLRLSFEMFGRNSIRDDNADQEVSATITVQPDRLALDINPGHDHGVWVSFLAGLILFNAGEHMAAVDLLDAAGQGAGDMRQPTDFQRALHFYRGANYIHLGHVQEALPELETLLPLDLAQYKGDETFAYSILINLGIVYAYLGELEQALEKHAHALMVAKLIDDPRRQALALANLGLAHRSLGRPEEAIDQYRQAIAIDSALGDRRAEAVDLGDLGLAYADLGRIEEAVDHYQQAIEIGEDIGDRRVEGNGLVNLANAYVASGRLAVAVEHYEQALAIAREIGNPWGEGTILANLGIVQAELGRVDEAADLYRQALEILEGIGAPNAAVVRELLAEVSP